jgi:inosine-uridine nucleoside N-ribohydrolase
MQGNIRPGFNGADKVIAEYNVAKYPHSCQAVFSAPWEMTVSAAASAVAPITVATPATSLRTVAEMETDFELLAPCGTTTTVQRRGAIRAPERDKTAY